MKKVFALICTVTLAACGGGGGNSTPSSQPTPNAGPSNPPTSQPATPPSTTTPATPATPAAPTDAQQTVGGNSIAIDNSNIKHIRVDGVDFDLTQSGGVTLNGWKSKVPGITSGSTSGEPKSYRTS